MIALAEPAYILFSLSCIQHYEVQHIRYIPPRVSEEQLPWVQVTPYRPHNYVILPRYLLHITLNLVLGGDGFGHLYIHYTTIGITPLCLIPVEQRNVIDNELPHRSINSLSVPKDKQFHNVQWHISVLLFLC